LKKTHGIKELQNQMENTSIGWDLKRKKRVGGLFLAKKGGSFTGKREKLHEDH